MTKRNGMTLFLLLIGAVIYACQDRASAHPVWFNWFFAMAATTSVVVLLRQRPKDCRGRVSLCAGWVIAIAVALPLLANTRDIAFRRDFERIRSGASQASVFRQMSPYTLFCSSSDGRTIEHTFRHPMRGYPYYWQAAFTLREGKVAGKRIVHYEVTPADSEWIFQAIVRRQQ